MQIHFLGRIISGKTVHAPVGLSYRGNGASELIESPRALSFPAAFAGNIFFVQCGGKRTVSPPAAFTEKPDFRAFAAAERLTVPVVPRIIAFLPIALRAPLPPIVFS